MDTTRWRALTAACGRLQSVMVALLTDWGACLELPLYQEALTHFLGGESRVIQRVPLARGGLSLGTQRMHVHATGIGFLVTAGQAAHETNLRKLLALTPLTALQWLNLDHATIRFITLTK